MFTHIYSRISLWKTHNSISIKVSSGPSAIADFIFNFLSHSVADLSFAWVHCPVAFTAGAHKMTSKIWFTEFYWKTSPNHLPWGRILLTLTHGARVYGTFNLCLCVCRPCLLTTRQHLIHQRNGIFDNCGKENWITLAFTGSIGGVLGLWGKLWVVEDFFSILDENLLCKDLISVLLIPYSPTPWSSHSFVCPLSTWCGIEITFPDCPIYFHNIHCCKWSCGLYVFQLCGGPLICPMGLNKVYLNLDQSTCLRHDWPERLSKKEFDATCFYK